MMNVMIDDKHMVTIVNFHFENHDGGGGRSSLVIFKPDFN